MTVKLAGAPAAVVATASRALIVSALGTIPDLSAFPDMPDVPTAGAAWPVYVQTTPDGWLSQPGLDTFDVWVLLPAGYSSATVAAADAIRTDIWAALHQPCVVQLCEPVTVQFDNQTKMPGLRLRVSMRGSER